ncbi:hypothetical protein, partial [Nesterenkonia marinintestina]|uniref:hypothetical protein n=1 Tax=Nesterenkonia marinintestina TaxID=2979865 RepID=UPI0021BF54BF
LVRRREGQRELSFTLPLLEQWCAAQAVQSTPALMDEAVSSPSSFELWRWAIALVLEEAEWPRYHELVTRFLEQDLGMGLWLIRESSKPNLGLQEPADNTQQQATRLKETLEHLVRTSPFYQELVFPRPAEGEQLTVDMTVTRMAVSVDWYSNLQSETASQMEAATAQSSRPISHWTVVPVAEKTWPWEYIRERPTRGMGMESRFWQHLDLGCSGGLWERERRYALASQLLDPGIGPAPQRISLERLRRRLDELSQHVDLKSLGSFKVGRLKVSGAAVSDLVNWARTCSDDEVERLVSYPMADAHTVDCPDDLFPQELVDTYVLETHGFGSEIYDEALTGLFSAFEWRWLWPDGAQRGVIGVTEKPPMQGTERDRIVMKIAVPVHLLDTIENEYGAPFDRSSNGRARFRASSGDRGKSLREAAFDVLNREGYRANGGPPQTWSSGFLRMSTGRPASLVAHDWIRQSLSAVGLDRALSATRRVD